MPGKAWIAAVVLAAASRAQSALEVASSFVERGAAPGAVVLVGRGATEVLRNAVGLRAVEPEREAMTVDTVFDLASLTKPIATATSVVLLAERGRVELAAPAARYLPEFGANGKEAITVEQLLLHTSGLVADNALADYADGPDAAWRRICELKSRSEPGSTFTYSDVGYIVLGQLVERVDGRSLDRFAQEELFTPLRMSSTAFRPGPELAQRAAPTEERGERWMRGEVHDPRAFALGGVAGHAGLFSTASDVARWCRMLLGGGELDGVRVLSRESVARMLAVRRAGDGAARTLALDADTSYSSARGDVFPRGESFGHTGFTGTSLWIDPGSGGYVVLLTNRVHPNGAGDVKEMRAAVATAAGRMLRSSAAVACGVDVLARNGGARLAGRKVALLTNATGRTSYGERTIDLLARASGVQLVAILAPEHGIASNAEGRIADTTEARTGVPIFSLYGETRRPTAAMLAAADTLVFDVQDAGTRIYTYESTLGYAMEAARECGVRFVVLDRPSPIGFVAPSGPCADADRLDFTSNLPIPLVHGLTIGELALLYRDAYDVKCELEVVRCEGWRRAMTWEETGLEWIPPSPNLRTPLEALLYPGVALLETTNVSVGRGTDEPFERFGAPWIDAAKLASALNELALPGLRFEALEFTPNASRFANELCRGVRIVVHDRAAVRPVEAGLAFARTLARLFGERFELEKVDALLRSRATHAALSSQASDAELRATWEPELAEFELARKRVLLYR
jgi:uncharacterized protein YbbC (DUF1343 family)